MSTCSKTRDILYLVGYTEPRFHDTSKSYVDFYAYDPVTEKVRRKKYHLDSIRGTRARRQYAAQLCARLSAKLRDGWRPWSAATGNRGYTPIEECCGLYMDRVRKTGRPKTVNSYQSRVNVLLEYISTLSRPPKYICQINAEFCVDFLDWIFTERGAGPRTVNNYRNWLRVFSSFMIERKYFQECPVSGIAKMREKPKRRQPLTEGMLRQVFTYLRETDPDFLLAVMMEYYTFIRPGELSCVRICDISVSGQSVFVPGIVSKNRRDGYVALNETVLRQMLENGVFNNPDSDYLFSIGFRPGSAKVRPDVFNKRWAKMRKALGWGPEYQFYSLKDSGIRDLAESKGIVTARNQARHTDISTTNKYIQGQGQSAPEGAKHFKGDIG